MAMQFKIEKATKTKSKARILFQGPAGSGKTYTALKVAKAFGGSTIVIDTEAGSSHKYADQFGEFDVLQLEKEGGDEPYSPERYTEAIKFCGDHGYENIIVDSLTHAWNGKGGALEQVDKAAKRFGGNTRYAWADVTPKHRRLFQTIIQSPANIFGTMRTKTVYAEQKQNGRTTYKKQGTSVIQRDETDYEFDVVVAMDLDHVATVIKSRVSEIDQAVVTKPGLEFGRKVKAVLTEGADEAEVVKTGKVYPKTKTGLLNWASENVGWLEGKGQAEVGNVIKSALENLSMEFDPEKWDTMQAAVSNARP